jgi:outer membrane protein OmpA-like peptidoglycan-associated protein
MNARASIAVAVLALSACTDFTKYTAEAETLVKQYGPQVANLIKDNDGLLAKLKGLPQGAGGVAELIAKVTANQDKLANLKNMVNGLPGLLANAVKGGKEDEVQKVLSTFKTEVSGGLTQAQTAVKAFSTEVEAVAAKAAEAPKDAAQFTKQLSTGFSLKGQVTGIEAQLVNFIEDSGKKIDKTTWFDFDRLTFKTGSADLDLDKSKDQLTNVAEILKAYPKTELKVGGYTDNQGKPDANKKLSDARAKAVVAQLKTMGIEAKRLDPEGYGQEHPVCAANDTDECRAKNRRISVRVKAK